MEGQSEGKGFPVTAAEYKLLEEIGQGSSAIVYRALCLPYNEVVAIKCLDLEKCNRNTDELRQEAIAVSSISHPNLVKAYCSFVVDRSLWVVMPYMAGESCLYIMKAAFANGFEEPVIATVLKETLKALEFLHHLGRIHGDVKAGNILIDGNGAVKLGDKSVPACVLDTGDQRQSRNTTAESPCWMASEGAEKCHGRDSKADIWSLGVTALELAHGHTYRPMKVSLTTFQNGPPGLDYAHDGRFSKPFKEMIAMCLVQDPSKRPTAEKLLSHPFFKLARTDGYIYRTILDGIPPLGERVKNLKLSQNKTPVLEEEEISQNEYKRGISKREFNVEVVKTQSAAVTWKAGLPEVGGELCLRCKGRSSLDLINALAERDAALLEKSTALAEKMAACAERDAAILQRDVALADRDSAILGRDAAMAALARLERGAAAGRGRRKPQTATVGVAHGSKLLQRVELTENCRLTSECQPSASHTSHSDIMLLDAESTHHQAGMHRFGEGNEPQIEIFVRTKRRAASDLGDASLRKELLRPPPKKSHHWPVTHQRPQQPPPGQRVASQVDDEEEEGQIREPELVTAAVFSAPSVPTPIPYCSCTGLNQQCYRWGNGGWQSACCTTMISMFPLPMNPKKRGSRLAGRKMSAGAFEKLLEKLLSEGVNISYPVDLREHWAKHGTNRYVTLR